jgi:hypothetical protein
MCFVHHLQKNIVVRHFDFIYLGRCYILIRSDCTSGIMNCAFFLHIWKGVETARDSIVMLHAVYVGKSFGPREDSIGQCERVALHRRR